MTKVALSLCVLSVLFCVGCGSSGSSGPPPKGNYSNSSLSGHYAYQITGFDLSGNGNRYAEAGVFTADGNGNITGGTDDFSEGSPQASATSSGTYSISNDGTGSAVLNISNGRQISLVVTLVSSSKANLIVAPLSTSFFASGAGVAEKQDTTAFAAPSGTFVFKWHGTSAGVPVANVGAFTVASGTLSSGSEDALILGAALSSPTFTSGTLNPPDSSTGRGTGSFTDSNNVSSTFDYYVVNAGNLRFLLTSSLGIGRAEQQTGGSFAAASLSGGYAFGSVGDTASFFNGSNTVGAITAGGNGTISAGAYDAVENGTVTSNASLSGTYTVAASGRAAVSLNSGAIQEVYWLVSPSRAFVLIDDLNRVEDGTADLQSGSFSNSTMNGQFSVFMDGSDTAPGGVNTYDRVGTLQWNGIGGLGLNEAINLDGQTTTPGFLTGSYAVSNNGRATGSISSLSSNLVFYLVSGSSGYVLQGDSGIEISGAMSLQTP
jgi:hypothetical protein